MEQLPITLELRVTVGDGADAEFAAAAAGQLREELLELDVETVESLPAGPAPPGTRAVDLVAIGGMVISFARSGLLSNVIDVVRTWLRAEPERSITLEIDGDVLSLTGVSSAEQRRLADEWLARRSESYGLNRGPGADASDIDPTDRGPGDVDPVETGGQREPVPPGHAPSGQDVR
jgi:hypothetical protein